MKKLAFAFFFSLLFFSCEKDKQLIVENTDTPLISKVLIGGEMVMEYSYNNANLVAEEKSKFHYAKHTYNNINQLMTSDIYWDMRIASSNVSVLDSAMNRTEWVNPDNTPKSISHVLDYNSMKHIVRKSFIRLSGDNSDIVEFQYENDRIVRLTGYYNNSITGYTDYLYDHNGNIIKETKYRMSSAGIAELSTTSDYEYDNMHNPYQSFKRLLTPGTYTNPNNITKETYTIHLPAEQGSDNVQITAFSYEYNALGYPVTQNDNVYYVYN
jgi:hypothetical protein